MYRIAFVTYKKYPALSEDDFLVTKYLEERGVDWVAVPWNEPGVNWENFDAIILRSCWDYFLYYEKFLEWLKSVEENSVKIFNDIRTVRWNLDKSYLLKISERGILVPESFLINKNQKIDLIEMLNRKSWKKAVVKPTISAGAFETWLIDEGNVIYFQSQLEKLIPNRSFLIQEYREEIETIGEVSLIFFNKRYSHSVRKRPKKNDFRVQLKFGGEVEAYQPSSSAIEAAEKIINLYKEEDFLYARVDGIETDEGFYLMELELIEPNLYLAYDSKAPGLFFHSIYNALRRKK